MGLEREGKGKYQAVLFDVGRDASFMRSLVQNKRKEEGERERVYEEEHKKTRLPTMAFAANFLISFTALGALFLNETPCTCNSDTATHHQSFSSSLSIQREEERSWHAIHTRLCK